MQQIVVTGLGMLTTLGNDARAFFAILVDGPGGIGPVQAVDAGDSRFKTDGEAKAINSVLPLRPAELRHMDRGSRLPLTVADGAIGDAGLDLEGIDTSPLDPVTGMILDGFMVRAVNQRQPVEDRTRVTRQSRRGNNRFISR